MVDYIKNNFAVWAKYQGRPMSEGWERFAERVVGIDDDGHVVYKNTETAQVEDNGGSPKNLYEYDNTFGGIVFGDTGVPTRIHASAWDSLELYDGSDTFKFPVYQGGPNDDDGLYYDTATSEWKIGSLTGTHAHDDLYVNVVGGDTMEGPLVVGTGGGISCTGNLWVYSGFLRVDAGDIIFNNNYQIVGYNNVQTTQIPLLEVTNSDVITLGNSSYNMDFIPGPGDWIGYGSNLVGPFYDLDGWTDGFVPAWNSASGRFDEFDPSTVEWDRTLDLNEMIYADDGGGDEALCGNLAGVATFGHGNVESKFTGGEVTLLSVGAAADVNITAGRHINLNSATDVVLDPDSNSIDTRGFIEFNAANLGVMLHDGSSSYTGMVMNSSANLLIGDSSVVLVNLRGNPTRPQYNGNDLALLTDAGGGPGIDTSAIHDDIADEITAITAITGLAGLDEFICEDQSDSFNKKAVTWNTIQSELEGDLGGPWLPLTAGSGEPLTGNLYVETAADPLISLREGGVATKRSDFVSPGDGSLSIRQYETTGVGIALISLNPVTDGTKAIHTRIFAPPSLGTNAYLQVYKGNNTWTEAFRVTGNSGEVKLFTGNLYLDKAANPGIYLREGGSATSYSHFYDDGTALYIRKREPTGVAYINIYPEAVDASSAAILNFFRHTNTAGTRNFNIYEGDGTATVQHQFNAGTGDVNLCQQAGQLTVGGTGGAYKVTVVGSSIALDHGYGLTIRNSSATYREIVAIHSDDVFFGHPGHQIYLQGAGTVLCLDHFGVNSSYDLQLGTLNASKLVQNDGTAWRDLIFMDGATDTVVGNVEGRTVLESNGSVRIKGQTAGVYMETGAGAFSSMLLLSSTILTLGNANRNLLLYCNDTIDILGGTLQMNANALNMENGQINLGTGDILGDYGSKLILKDSATAEREMVTMDGTSRIFGGIDGGITWVEGNTLKLFRYGYSGSAAPSSTTWPTTGSWGIHIDDGDVFLVYQNGGTPVGVQLTAIW